MRQGSKSMLSAEEVVEQQEERMAVVSHYTELVRQYSTPEFRQRSLSRDRETKRYESPAESRVASPVRSLTSQSSIQKERLPINSGKIITPIPPIASMTGPKITGKIITPIPPVIPTTPIQRAKPISPSEQNSRRNSLTNRVNGIEPDPSVTRGRSRIQEPADEMRRSRRSSVIDSRSTTPTQRRPESRPTSRNETRPDSRNESQPPSRNESPMPRSRNVSRDRGPSVAGSRSSSRTRVSESSSRSAGGVRPTKSSRPSSRSSSKDRSRAGSPTEIELDRLQRALDDKRARLRRTSTKDEDRARSEEATGGRNALLTRETERKVRSTISYAMDVGLLMAATYVYLFKNEVYAIPILALLLFRYIQQEVRGWIPAWYRRR